MPRPVRSTVINNTPKVPLTKVVTTTELQLVVILCGERVFEDYTVERALAANEATSAQLGWHLDQFTTYHTSRDDKVYTILQSLGFPVNNSLAVHEAGLTLNPWKLAHALSPEETIRYATVINCEGFQVGIVAWEELNLPSSFDKLDYVALTRCYAGQLTEPLERLQPYTVAWLVDRIRNNSLCLTSKLFDSLSSTELEVSSNSIGVKVNGLQQALAVNKLLSRAGHCLYHGIEAMSLYEVAGERCLIVAWDAEHG